MRLFGIYEGNFKNLIPIRREFAEPRGTRFLFFIWAFLSFFFPSARYSLYGCYCIICSSRLLCKALNYCTDPNWFYIMYRKRCFLPYNNGDIFSIKTFIKIHMVRQRGIYLSRTITAFPQHFSRLQSRRRSPARVYIYVISLLSTTRQSIISRPYISRRWRKKSHEESPKRKNNLAAHTHIYRREEEVSGVTTYKNARGKNHH